MSLQLRLQLLSELNHELRVLRIKVEQGRVAQTWGICAYLSPMTVLKKCLLEELWSNWPKYSGEPGYPVPSSTGGNPYRAYMQASVNGHLWQGEYGAMRKNLLNYLIEVTNHENSTPAP